MLFTKILFLILIIICAAFYVLYIWDFSLVLLIVIASMPIIMFVMLLITKLLIKVEFSVRDHTFVKNEPIDVQLCIENKSIFPVGKAEALIEYYNVFNNEINSLELHFPIQARNRQRLTFQLSSKFCGIVKIRSVHITIFDPLRIFKFKVGKDIREDLVIIPQGHDINGSVIASDRPNDDSLFFSENRPGDDPSEVFDLREYEPGDKLNRIHWKLSSKKDDFIVKDYSFPVDSPVTLMINLHCCEDSEYTLPMYDTLIEALVSVSQLLIENERIHTVIYYNGVKDEFTECMVSDDETLAEAVRRLIASVRDNLHFAKPDLYFAENNISGLTSFTYITAEKDDKLLSYIDEEADADMKNVIQIVKNIEEFSADETFYSALNIIPVMVGRISSSIRDIEL